MHLSTEVKDTEKLQARGRVTLSLARVRVMLIIEDPTVTVKCGAALQALFLY